jgi:hypothetical protein
MQDYMNVTLKHPKTIPGASEQLETITIRRAASGDMMLARAQIINDKRLGASCLTDPLIVGMFILRRIFVSCNVIKALPIYWPEMLEMEDLTELYDSMEALTGFYDSLADYRADAEKRQKEAAAAEAQGDSFQTASPVYAGNAGTGDEARSTGSGNEGGAGERAGNAPSAVQSVLLGNSGVEQAPAGQNEKGPGEAVSVAATPETPPYTITAPETPVQE